MIGDELKQEQVECEQHRQPLVHHSEELDAGHDR
jgi:hypothetical protein